MRLFILQQYIVRILGIFGHVTPVTLLSATKIGGMMGCILETNMNTNF